MSLCLFKPGAVVAAVAGAVAERGDGEGGETTGRVYYFSFLVVVP